MSIKLNILQFNYFEHSLYELQEAESLLLYASFMKVFKERI